MTMAVEAMNTQQHAETARDFLVAADREIAAGDTLQGSEKLWESASHAVMAVARQRGWTPNSHSAMKNAVARLSEELHDPALRGEFGTAEKFHANFYHGFMEDYELAQDGEVVHRFVERVLSLL